MADITKRDEIVFQIATELLPQATIVQEEPGKIRITVPKKWGQGDRVVYFWSRILKDNYLIYVPDSKEEPGMKIFVEWYKRGNYATNNWKNLSDAEKEKESCFVTETGEWKLEELIPLIGRGAHLEDIARCWGPVKVSENISGDDYERAKKLFENQLMSHGFI